MRWARRCRDGVVLFASRRCVSGLLWSWFVEAWRLFRRPAQPIEANLPIAYFFTFSIWWSVILFIEAKKHSKTVLGRIAFVVEWILIEWTDRKIYIPYRYYLLKMQGKKGAEANVNAKLNLVIKSGKFMIGEYIRLYQNVLTRCFYFVT